MQVEDPAAVPTFGVHFTVKLFLIFVTSFVILKRFTKKHYNLPPGPKNYPVLGCFPLIDHKKPFETFCNWARQYGKLYYCHLGGDPVVVLNDPGLIKEAFGGDHFLERPRNPGVTIRKAESGGHAGLIFSAGTEWKEHRRFVMRSFKDFGIGKQRNEDKIAEEAGYLMQMFRDTKGLPFDNKIPISTAVANVISNVVSNSRYSADDPEFVEVLNSIAALFRTSFASAMINSYPWTRFLPPFRSLWNHFDSCAKKISAYFGKITDEHFESWNENRERDVMDAYITAMKTSDYTTFAPKQLAYLVEDLMEAGYETTTTSLRWAFLLMAAYPEIQRKVQEELDTNIPTGSLARPTDRRNLPYTEAVIAEVHRFASIVPFGLMHVSLVDNKLDSFDIPKGTWLLPNLYFIHHDEKLWDDPMSFRPDRFLSLNGKTERLPEHFMPFSVGKRRCPGESLAQDEMLMFFTAILRNFTLSLPEGETANLNPLPGATLDTVQHSLVVIPRT